MSIADLFLKLNGDDQENRINNPDTYDPNYIYNKNKLYCYTNGIWIQSNNKLSENVKHIIVHFKIYNFLVTPIKKYLNRLVETQYINNIVEELKLNIEIILLNSIIKQIL